LLLLLWWGGRASSTLVEQAQHLGVVDGGEGTPHCHIAGLDTPWQQRNGGQGPLQLIGVL
jgi:hypothetical protein